ncbi:MAG: potassium-transporting ATPase subunit KdpA [Roseiflexaceae bacterium]|nr:potassium-transporting ATPase subunit KdpA [Roseiflexaceae bacterium]
MNVWSYAQYALFLAIVIALVWPAGAYLARVFAAERTLLDPLLRPIERLIYRAAGVDAREEMSWQQYAVSFVLFSAGGTLLLYALLRLQPGLHPADPAFAPVPLAPDLAMNTAISFATTTTWQAYGGETTMSYWSQMVGLAAQNFLAGAAGLAVGMAFIRGLARQVSGTVGNFWVDLTRATLWVLLPIALIGALVLVWQGVPANFSPYQPVALLQPLQNAEGQAVTQQIIPQGPVAALELIKNLGTNGGGFFNVNAAHPYENPTPLTNLIELLAIVVLPAGLTATFGRMVGNQRHGWLLLAVMVTLFVAGLAICDWAEQAGNPRVAALGVDILPGGHSGGNMEGKETRFGIGGSVLAAITTSNGATGSYNSMHASYTPIGGAVALVNMLLGELVFGGLGTGIYSIILVALIGLFIGGLMVGRTPEYLGKQITVPEIKLVALATTIAPLTVLLLSALAIATPWGRGALYDPQVAYTSIFNPGPHGFTEVFYAYASAFANNGQNFASLGANNPFYNITLALAMMVGRFGLAIPALALAGLFAQQRRKPASIGALPLDTPLFALLTLGTILLVSALNYIPMLALGPLIEHLLMVGVAN